MTQPNNPTNYIYVPLYIDLYADLVLRSGTADVSGYIEHSVQSFLERTEGDADIWSAEYIQKLYDQEDEAFLEKYGNPERGYQWQTVFLPNGTKVWMSYKSQDSYAEIRHGKLHYGEEVMSSPSQFASRVAGNTNRNAWRDLYIKFPGEGSWKLASSLRRREAFSLSDF